MLVMRNVYIGNVKMFVVFVVRYRVYELIRAKVGTRAAVISTTSVYSIRLVKVRMHNISTWHGAKCF